MCELGGAAEHLIDGSEKRICRLSFRVMVRLHLQTGRYVMYEDTKCTGANQTRASRAREISQNVIL